MNKTKLKEVIQDQRLPGKDYVPRAALKRLEELHATPFVIIISGLRRSGKSTLLDLMRSTHDGHYMNFDDERLLDFTVDDFQAFHELLIELYGDKKTLYLDEIQNIRGWERFVRRLRDSNYKVYVTGSNATLLSKELGTHLTGRYVQLTLYPFSFKEYLTLNKKSSSLPTTTQERVATKRAFNKYLTEGGLPEYLRTKQQEYLKTLYENILYRDVIVRYKLTNARSIKELMHFVTSNISKELSYNSLKKSLGLGSATTVKEYLHYFEQTYLLFLVPKHTGVKKQLYANKKAYLIDNALAGAVGYRLSKDAGRFLENTVFLELQRRGKTVTYHREKHECDFIADKEAIQVCHELTAENREREVKGLVEALSKLRKKKGTILTYDQEEEIEHEGKKIIVKPVWKWLLEK